MSLSYEHEYGAFASIITVAAGFLTTAVYRERPITFRAAFLPLALMIALAVPNIGSRYGFTFGMAPQKFAVLSIVVYLTFSLMMGFLMGMVWVAFAQGIRRAFVR